MNSRSMQKRACSPGVWDPSSGVLVHTYSHWTLRELSEPVPCLFRCGMCRAWKGLLARQDKLSIFSSESSMFREIKGPCSLARAKHLKGESSCLKEKWIHPSSVSENSPKRNKSPHRSMRSVPVGGGGEGVCRKRGTSSFPNNIF